MPREMPCTSYRFGAFTLDLERGALLSPATGELRLRPKSFALLCMLVENAGRLLSPATIMDELWPNIFVTENNVNQCVCEIRKALGGAAARLLRTVPRRGYLFLPDPAPSPAAGITPAGSMRPDRSGVASSIRATDGARGFGRHASPSQPSRVHSRASGYRVAWWPGPSDDRPGSACGRSSGPKSACSDRPPAKRLQS